MYCKRGYPQTAQSPFSLVYLSVLILMARLFSVFDYVHVSAFINCSKNRKLFSGD